MHCIYSQRFNCMKDIWKEISLKLDQSLVDLNFYRKHETHGKCVEINGMELLKKVQ